MKEDPMMRANPVPTAKRGGTPRTRSPLVARNPTPTPKNPPNMPTINPSSSNRAGLTSTPALGKTISVLFIGGLSLREMKAGIIT
jgi:hypothetical protein